MNKEMVIEALQEAGMETPMFETFIQREEKKDRIKLLFAQIMDVIGLNLLDDSLKGTPARLAKMYVDEIFSGLDYDNFPKITTIENKMGVDCMVVERDITLHSTCEHHFVTIAGHCHIAYIPKDTVIGLSKMNRLVQFFSQRPQVQERLTQQIMIAMKTLLGTEDVMVMIKAKHYCVASRGIRDTASSTVTTAISGEFKTDPQARTEFLEAIK